MSLVMKRCSTCKIEKDLLSFYKNKCFKDGHQNECIDCAKIRNSKRKSKVSEYSRKYHRTEKGKSANKAYYQKHKEKLQSSNAEYYQEHREEILSKEKLNYEQSPERKRAKLSSAIKTKHGIDIDEYERLVKKFNSEQNGCCKICGRDDVKLVLDHNHETGEHRALLCSQCNAGIGCLKEDPMILLSAYNFILGF